MRAYDGIFRRIRRWLRHRLLDVRQQYACVASSLPPRLHPESAIVIAVISLVILSAVPTLAADILIIQSGNGPAYSEAVRGFKEVCKESSRTILLSDYAEVDVVRLVKEEQPRLVLAVGDPALAASRKVRRVPVVAVLALSATLQRPPVPNIHAVSMAAAPARYLGLFNDIGAKRVGVLYDPARTGFYLKRAREAAEKSGLTLVAREVRDPRQALEQLDQLNGKVDALWMLPDTTAVTGATVEAYFTFSMKQQLPLVSFSERHLARGAAASLDIDRVDQGRQAGELALSLLRDGAGRSGTAVDPRNIALNTNQSIARKLRVDLPAPAR